jgi:hypothetical protein
VNEEEYQRELESIKDKPDIEEHFQSNPDAGSSVKTVMFVCACVAMAHTGLFRVCGQPLGIQANGTGAG